MKTRTTTALVVVAVAVPAMVLGPALFPMSDDWPAIVGTQLLLMGGIAAVEALALGLAVAFLLLGWPHIRQLVGPSRPRTVAAYVATAWLLGNWWLHDNLHAANGTNLNGLIAIEYGFHATLIVAGGIVAWQLLRSIEERPLRTTPPASQRPS